MKTTYWTYWIIGVLIVVGGSWIWLTKQHAPAAAPVAPGPSQAAGINGSPNQGNLGQPDDGTVQQPSDFQAPIMAWTPEPGADGYIEPIIGDNLTLGTDGTDALGTYLIGYTGKPVYTYDKDTGTKSTCTGTCAKNWPPYVVAPTDIINHLESAVRGAVGTTTIPAGYSDPSGYTIQLTYGGHPLYFYAGDTATSKATGDGKAGVWHVARP
jgi:predicted lipoprotein with Yx(FWY)xxD motif